MHVLSPGGGERPAELVAHGSAISGVVSSAMQVQRPKPGRPEDEVAREQPDESLGCTLEHQQAHTDQKEADLPERAHKQERLVDARLTRKPRIDEPKHQNDEGQQ